MPLLFLGAKQNYLDSTTNVARMQSFGLDVIAERNKPTFMKKWDAFTNYLEENRQHIFYIFVYYVITIALFIERFIFYAFLAEHLDLRHIMGVGIAITRGKFQISLIFKKNNKSKKEKNIHQKKKIEKN